MIEDHLARLGSSAVGTVQTPAGPVRYLAYGGALRFESILTKEPETIEWIDGFQPGETLWDIGANLGIYSIYAGLRGAKVLAFEPHFANYFQLCQNIMLNGLQEAVTPLCLAIARGKRLSTMNLAHVDFGSALSSFDSDRDYRGRRFDVAYRQGMIGYGLDELAADFDLPSPDHIKIDVDGIELDIVKGARRLLADERIRSVSVELVDTDCLQVDGVRLIMAESGLQFVHKKQNPIYGTTESWDVLNFLFRRARPKADVCAEPPSKATPLKS